MTKKETDKVLEIVDRCFHMYASAYRNDAQEQAKQMLAEQVPERHISMADHREAMRMAAVGYERELADARRQVAVLVSMAMFAPCAHCDAKDFCDNQPAATPCEENIAAWAAQQAKEGGK
jgi:hypothetical protein